MTATRIFPGPTFRLIALVVTAIALPHGSAVAGLVDVQGGGVQLTAGGAAPLSFPLEFPGTGAHAARSDSVFAGETRVVYETSDAGGGASFDVTQQDGGDTRSAFSVTFKTGEELQFRLLAEPRPHDFSIRFNGIRADARFDALGADENEVYRGSLVHLDPFTGKPDGFETRTFEGELPAGTYTFSVEAWGNVDRGTVVDGGGRARLILALPASAVPLPPALWPALATALAAAAWHAVRRRVG